jgi:hypothetical protein
MRSGVSYIPPSFRTYVNNNNLAGYFTHENWQGVFPELVGKNDIINTILTKNPKGMILNDNFFAILKDSTKNPLTDNVLIGFKLGGSPECDVILGTLPQ